MYEYKARLNEVIDGDTLDLMVDLGFYHYTKVRVRLEGIDTPEIWGVDHDSEEYKKGMEASLFVQNWIEENSDSVGHIFIRTKKHERGKYGRWLAEILPISNSNPDIPGSPSLNVVLLNEELAEEYDGS